MKWKSNLMFTSKRCALSCVLGLVFCSVFLCALRSKPGSPTAGKHAVVVELFTSEGCSSCPPADELLGRLRQSASSNGAEVIPLGFHVDYWDSAAWHDRFDSAAYSHRQENYARKFHIDGPYTPQMVVNGQVEFVGSLAGDAREAIAQAAQEVSAADVRLSLANDDLLRVTVANSQPAQVMLAITEDNLFTNVAGGENGGRTLHHSAVVRQLQRLGEISGGRFSTAIPLKLNNGWKRQDLRTVVFIQESESGKILGGASISLHSLAGAN
jgi:hypothetical protein